MYASNCVGDVIFSLNTKEIFDVKEWDLNKKLAFCVNVRKFANTSKQTDFAITEKTFLRFWDQLNAIVQLQSNDYVGHGHLLHVMAFEVTDENLPTVWSVLCPSYNFYADYLLELCGIVEAKLASMQQSVLRLPLLNK
jgi:hypothetical protein